MSCDVLSVGNGKCSCGTTAQALRVSAQPLHISVRPGMVERALTMAFVNVTNADVTPVSLASTAQSSWHNAKHTGKPNVDLFKALSLINMILVGLST